MAQSVNLADEIMHLVSCEAELRRRSIADQITHWVHVGRAIENAGDFNYDRVTAALAGEIEPASLSFAENLVWLDQFVGTITSPSPEEEVFFALRRHLGLGVGLDEGDNLVWESDQRPLRTNNHSD